MNKLFSILLGTALAGPALGMDMDMDMKTMDTNKDGMISKQEFMKYHEAMWEKMKKDNMGMVDVKEMERMHGEMMKGDGMMKDHKMMKDDKMMKGDGMKDSMKK
jgi:hypothetical protein